MERKAVTSSNVVSVGHDPETNVLEVEFKGGAVYQYHYVPERVYDEIMRSDSVGKFINQHIKDVYTYTRL